MDQVNIQTGDDPLLAYRVGKLEETVTVLSDGLADIVATIKGAKWAFLAIFGVMQPILIALLIHYFLTKG